MFDDRLSLRKLEVFLAFLRTENIAKTAEDLGTAAVSVHRALHTLEETLLAFGSHRAEPHSRHEVP